MQTLVPLLPCLSIILSIPMDHPVPSQKSASPLPQSHTKTPQFPSHNDPRVWFLTDGLSPIAISLSRHLLQHGDYVVSGVLPLEYAGERGDDLREFIGELGEQGLESQDDEDDMDVDDESDGEHSGGEDTGEEKEVTGHRQQKRRRSGPWIERFKVVALDGR
jgi:hypothetical protein